MKHEMNEPTYARCRPAKVVLLLGLGAALAAVTTHAADYYVDAGYSGSETGSPTAPFNTLGEALAQVNASSGPHIIRVAAARHDSAIESFPLVVSNSASIYGGYAGYQPGSGTFDWVTRSPRTTVLDGQGAGQRLVYQVFANWSSKSARYDGLAFVNANHTGTGGAYASALAWGTSVYFNDCLFTNNVSGKGTGDGQPDTGVGGGAALIDSRSTIDVRNCDFLDNRSAGAGGAIWMYAFDAGIVSNCTFRGNRTQTRGGGLFAIGGGDAPGPENKRTRVLDSTFVGNSATNGGYAGGAAFCPKNLMELDRCVFVGNYAPSGAQSGGSAVGGPGYWVGKHRVVNCLLYANTGSPALMGRSSVHAPALDVRFCTIVSNPQGGILGGTDLWNNNSGWLAVSNSVVANNGAEGVRFVWYNGTTNPGRFSIGHVDSSGHTTSNFYTCAAMASFSLDPRFADAGNRNYRLLPGSPCINAAANTGVALDLDRRPRPFNPRDPGYDLGCFETEPPAKGAAILVR